MKTNIKESNEIKSEIIAFVRQRLGAAVATKEVEFVKDLPKTRSGKIMRRLLKAKDQGLPFGDTSSLMSEEYL